MIKRKSEYPILAAMNTSDRNSKIDRIRRKRQLPLRVGTRLTIASLFILQIATAVWINSKMFSNLRAHAFGKTIIQRKKSNSDFFDSFRTANRETNTELFFAPISEGYIGYDSSFTDRQHAPTSAWSSSFSFSNPSLSRLVLFGQKGGSKGDKQKRKPKKRASESSSASSSASTSTSTSPQPQRVSNHINVPIRRQIRYGKINKQLREAAESGNGFRQTRNGNFVAVGGPGGVGPVKRTSYRKSLDEETIQQKALERQRKGQDPDWSVVLNQTKADPLVLVDGYNVIYKWPRLKKHMVKGDTERARQLLLEDLEGLASLQRWRIECVFDGAGRAGLVGPLGHGPGMSGRDVDVGKNPTLAPFGKTGTVRTAYTGRSIEADTYIEGRCAAAKNVTMGLTTSMLMVATDDSQIKLVANSAGALCMSSDRFVSELKAVKKGMQYRVEKAVSEINNTPMRPESQWGKTSPNEARFTAGDPDDYKKKPRREILEEKEDGSKLMMVRYGAHEMVVKDNRNKKPRVRTPIAGVAKKKKKKKKKKK